MIRLLIIITFVLTNQLFGQVQKIKVKRDNSDISKTTIVGVWVNKNNKTKDNKEYARLNCKDTIHYLADGTYMWLQCDIRETGKWKMSPDGKKVIKYDRKSAYWETYLNTSNLGEMCTTVTELDKKHFVSLISDEELGSIRQYYYPIK